MLTNLLYRTPLSLRNRTQRAVSTRLICLGFVLAVLPQAKPQSPNVPANPPAFSVATIRINDSGRNGIQTQIAPDGVSIANIPLQNLLSETFGVEPNQVLGLPDALKYERYDIQAKVAEEDTAAMKTLTMKQKLAMLQSLLEERFSLKFHHETRELPIYMLRVAKGGMKMQEWKRPDAAVQDASFPHKLLRKGRTELDSQGTTMSDLAKQLSSILGRTVVDGTSLTGNYDYMLQWADESSGASDAGPSIFTAVQEQLGLRLEAGKGPVDVIVVDHIEHPSPN